MNEEDSFLTLFAPENDAEEIVIVEPWKVLLVDDEVDIHAVLRLALQNLKIENRPLQLLDAHSATQAKLQLAGKKPSAINTDTICNG